MGNIFTDINVYWPELKNKFPGFDKPELIPAQALRARAAIEHADYMKDQIDQDPTAEYLFIKGNPKKGPCDRDTAVQLFYELMSVKAKVPSSFEMEYGLSPLEAADMEVLPRPADRRQKLGDNGIFADFEEYFKEQMQAMQGGGEEAHKADDEKFKEKFGFDRNDPDIIDVDVVGTDDGREVYAPAADQAAAKNRNALAQAKQYGLAEPKPILYCVDVHPGFENGALGFDGRHGLGGRPGRRGIGRGPNGFLHEEDIEEEELMTAEEFFGPVAECDECDNCDDPECKAGEKCGVRENDDYDEIDIDEGDDPAKYFYKADEDEEIEEGYLPMDEFEEDDEEIEEDDDGDVDECGDEDGVLNESFSMAQIRAWNRLTRIDQ